MIKEGQNKMRDNKKRGAMIKEGKWFIAIFPHIFIALFYHLPSFISPLFHFLTFTIAVYLFPSFISLATLLLPP
jgi:hypothetical protein